MVWEVELLLRFASLLSAKYSRISIIRISRLSGLFLASQFGHEYLRQAIFFVNIFRQGAVKCESFCPQRAKAALSLVVSNEEHSNHSNWIRVALLLGEISRSTAWKTTRKLASRTFIHNRHLLKLKRSVLSIKDKNQDADASVFQMICKMISKTSVRQAIFFVNIFRQGAVK